MPCKLGINAVFRRNFRIPRARGRCSSWLPPESPAAEVQVGLWKRAAHLTHPNLLAIFDAAAAAWMTCHSIYVVMEFAEETSAKSCRNAPSRRMKCAMFSTPALDVLVYLHGKGLVHGHLKPSNILATHDRLKLSSDSIFPIGEKRQLLRGRDLYDAPEMQSSLVSARKTSGRWESRSSKP